jgi:chemotaxis protein methyltransferase CheR
MNATEELEITLLLEAIYRQYGYDFRHYARASITRRLRAIVQKLSLQHISELIPVILYNRETFMNLVFNVSVTVTEMFRDPSFFLALRQQIIPFLKTYPHIKIWHAGCSTGEEVYSLAILLHEEGIYDRCTIFATDFNTEALAKAREGIFPMKALQSYTRNYQLSGGKASFSDYYHARYDHAKMRSSLTSRVTFAEHNLATDAAFGEMHLVICRNVLIYFSRPLQDRVFSLFDTSLLSGGFLALGSKETIAFASIAPRYEQVEETLKVYRKAYEKA